LHSLEEEWIENGSKSLVKYVGHEEYGKWWLEGKDDSYMILLGRSGALQK
jgi:hypothetical protein